MKKFVCEMCGSSDIVKKNGVFVCQSCGVKYSVEEAKQMMVEDTGQIKSDNEARINNILVNIERAFSDGKYEQVQTLCMQVLEEDANNVYAILREGLALGWQGNTVRYHMNYATTAANRAIKLAASQKIQNFEEFVCEAVSEIHILASALIKLCGKNINDTSREAVKRLNTLTRRIEGLPYGYSSDAIDILVEQGHYEKQTSEEQINKYDSVIGRTVSDVMSVFNEVASYYDKMQWNTVNGIAVKLKEYTKIRNTALVKETWGLYAAYLEDNMPVETRYQNAVNLMKSATTIEDYSQVSCELEKISEYEDAQSLSKRCQEKIIEFQNNSTYEEAKKYMKSNRIPYYESAIELFESIRDWKDSKQQIETCKKKIVELKEQRTMKAEQAEIERREKKKQKKKQITVVCAIGLTILIIFVIGILLNQFVFIPNKYESADTMMKEGKYENAVKSFAELEGYKNSKEKAMEAKYLYIQNNLDNENETTYEYLDDLKEREYKDCKTIYDELYKWDVNCVINQNADDIETDMHEVNRYNSVYFHWILTGGYPDEEKQVSMTLSSSIGWSDTTKGKAQSGDRMTTSLDRIEYGTSWIKIVIEGDGVQFEKTVKVFQ